MNSLTNKIRKALGLSIEKLQSVEKALSDFSSEYILPRQLELPTEEDAEEKTPPKKPGRPRIPPMEVKSENAPKRGRPRKNPEMKASPPKPKGRPKGSKNKPKPPVAPLEERVERALKGAKTGNIAMEDGRKERARVTPAVIAEVQKLAARKLTQAVIAEAVGLHQTTVSKLMQSMNL